MIDGTVIRCYNVVRDLRVHTDSQLKFYDHTTVVTILRRLTILQQHFDKNIFINLYKTYVQPVLEYGNVICGPRYPLPTASGESSEIATKPSGTAHNYDDRPAKLNLKYHRQHRDMIMIYQLLHIVLK